MQYDLIMTLLQLYRHGHIQRHDPVALPPIPFAQLPEVLRPHGDKEKGRNVWHLGGVVAARLLELPLLHISSLSTESRQKRDGVSIMAQYIVSWRTPVRAAELTAQLGATSPPRVAEHCFRNIIRQGPCGLPIPDDLIRQAFRRVNIIIQSAGGTPMSQTEMDAYPFPATPNVARAHRPSVSSASAAESFAQSSLKLVTPVKSSASLVSLSCDSPQIDSPHDAQSAINALRRVQRKQDKLQRNLSARSIHESPWRPALTNWNLSQSRRVTVPSSSPVRKMSAPSSPLGVPVEKNRRSYSVASTPDMRRPSTSSPPERRRLPFEPSEAIASIDPELAALELSSALTKHVQCSVCGVEGVNFPNCRKCGLTFCSRTCRVDGAGNGKR